MGVFSGVWNLLRFKKKLTTQERLQNIDDQLEKLDGFLHLTRQRQNSAGFFLVTVSILVYCLSIVVVYLWYLPPQWLHRILYGLPFIVFPVLVYFLKKLLHYFFANKIVTNASAVKELKKDKKKILENVMDTETYKVAKELLHKYDPHRSLVEEGETPMKQTPKVVTNSDGQALRRRPVGPPEATPQVQVVKPLHASVNGYPTSSTPTVRMPAMHMRTPQQQQQQQQQQPQQQQQQQQQQHPQQMQQQQGGGAVRRPVPIAPILPRERSAFDKLADYLIGDGPNNRYALICKQCFGHNGMVLSGEFEFTSYRCCYCGVTNPSRKQRMNAPRLEQINRANMKKRALSEASSTVSTDTESSNKVEDLTEKEVESGVEENAVVPEDVEISKKNEERKESVTSITEAESNNSVEEVSKTEESSSPVVEVEVEEEDEDDVASESIEESGQPKEVDDQPEQELLPTEDETKKER